MNKKDENLKNTKISLLAYLSSLLHTCPSILITITWFKEFKVTMIIHLIPKLWQHYFSFTLILCLCLSSLFASIQLENSQKRNFTLKQGMGGPVIIKTKEKQKLMPIKNKVYNYHWTESKSLENLRVGSVPSLTNLIRCLYMQKQHPSQHSYSGLNWLVSHIKS